jgi:hypothetical protein
MIPQCITKTPDSMSPSFIRDASTRCEEISVLYKLFPYISLSLYRGERYPCHFILLPHSTLYLPFYLGAKSLACRFFVICGSLTTIPSSALLIST